MKTKLTLLFLFITSFAWSQDYSYEWAFKIGGYYSEYANGLVTDMGGNMYVAGDFNSGTVDFDPSQNTYNLTNSNINNSSVSYTYVAKYNPMGNLVWVTNTGGNSCNAIAIDNNANVYSVGYFSSFKDFDPGTGTLMVTSSGSDDVFISKLDNAGNFQWVKTIGGSGMDRAESVVVDPSGNVIITGTFQGTVDFDPGSGVTNLTATANSINNVFVVKLNSNGTFVWAKAITTSANAKANSIDIDISGNIYLTGKFAGTTDFNPGTSTNNLTSSSTNYSDAFICKLTSGGSYGWAKQIGNTGNYSEEGLCIQVSSAGVHITGWFNGKTDFDPSSNTEILSVNGFVSGSTGEDDVFIAKYDLSGNLDWAKRMGGALMDRSVSLSLDQDNNVFTTGVYMSTVDFDPGPGVENYTAVGQGDVFISKLNPQGGYVWSESIGGVAHDVGFAITVDDLGSVFGAGIFLETLYFPQNANIPNLTAYNNGSYNDFYLLKLNPMVGAAAITSSSNIISGGTVFFTDNSMGDASSWFWDFGDGSTSILQNPAHIFTGNGTYTITLIVSNGVDSDTLTMQDFISVSDPVSASLINNMDVEWTTAEGSIYSESGRSVCADSSGNVYVAGTFSSPSISFGNYTLNKIDTFDIYLVKYDETGSVVWATSASGGYVDEVSICSDILGNVYMTGYYESSITIGNFTFNTNSWQNMFVAKFNPQGNVLWANSAGSNSNSSGKSVCTDNLGNVYVAGEFQNNFFVGNDTLSSNGSYDAFLIKYNSTGTLLWATSAGSTASDEGNSVCTDNQGNIYMTGNFYNSISFGNTTLYANGANDMFLIKYDLSGSVLWAISGGGSSLDYGNSVCTDSLCNIYVTGDFSSGNFHVGSYSLINNGADDMYL